MSSPKIYGSAEVTALLRDAPRSTLEKLLHDQCFEASRIGSAALLDSLVRAEAPRPEKIARFYAGGTGALDGISAALMTFDVLDYVSIAARMRFFIACKPLLALRSEPRAWRLLDLHTLDHPTYAHKKEPRSSEQSLAAVARLPLARVEELGLRDEGYCCGEHSVAWSGWKALLDAIPRGSPLRRLEIGGCAFKKAAFNFVANKFGATIEAVEYIPANGSIGDALKLFAKTPRLVELKIVTWDTPNVDIVEFLAEAGAALGSARSERGRSVLERLNLSRSITDPAIATDRILSTLAAHYPELVYADLGRLEVLVDSSPPAPPPLSRLADLYFTLVICRRLIGAQLGIVGARHLHASAAFVAKTCPNLSKLRLRVELKSGLPPQSMLTLTAAFVDGLRGLAGLEDLTIESVALDTTTTVYDLMAFFNLELPRSLKRYCVKFYAPPTYAASDVLRIFRATASAAGPAQAALGIDFDFFLRYKSSSGEWASERIVLGLS